MKKHNSYKEYRLKYVNWLIDHKDLWHPVYRPQVLLEAIRRDKLFSTQTHDTYIRCQMYDRYIPMARAILDGRLKVEDIHKKLLVL